MENTDGRTDSAAGLVADDCRTAATNRERFRIVSEYLTEAQNCIAQERPLGAACAISEALRVLEGRAPGERQQGGEGVHGEDPAEAKVADQGARAW